MAVDAKTGQPIFPGSTSVGLRNVGSYQVSGQPFLTGSLNLDAGKIHMIEFPNVTKKVSVLNISPHMLVVMFNSGSGVTPLTVPGETGAQNFSTTSDVYVKLNYIPVTASATFETNIKCKKIYIANLTGEARFGGSGQDNLGYHVAAELTNVPSRRMYHLTGSGIDD